MPPVVDLLGFVNDFLPCTRLRIMFQYPQGPEQPPACAPDMRGQTHVTNFVEPLEPAELFLGSRKDLKHLYAQTSAPTRQPTRVRGHATRSRYRSRRVVRPCAVWNQVFRFFGRSLGLFRVRRTTPLSFVF